LSHLPAPLYPERITQKTSVQIGTNKPLVPLGQPLDEGHPQPSHLSSHREVGFKLTAGHWPPRKLGLGMLNGMLVTLGMLNGMLGTLRVIPAKSCGLPRSDVWPGIPPSMPNPSLPPPISRISWDPSKDAKVCHFHSIPRYSPRSRERMPNVSAADPMASMDGVIDPIPHVNSCILQSVRSATAP
jgi:hypothetical protein